MTAPARTSSEFLPGTSSLPSRTAPTRSTRSPGNADLGCGRPLITVRARIERLAQRLPLTARPSGQWLPRCVTLDHVSTHIVGLLHPGDMGAAVGRCLTSRGHTVLWASEGRSTATTDRAKAAGLDDAGTVAVVARDAEMIISVCPPHAATDMAWAVHGFRGLYVDANAISPGTAREVAPMITDSGGQYVDAGIIGLPPVEPGTTRLYLSGPDAGQVQALFAGTDLDTRIAGPALTAASAVKMAYGAWTKGTAALILAIRELAKEEGVEEALLT